MISPLTFSLAFVEFTIIVSSLMYFRDGVRPGPWTVMDNTVGCQTVSDPLRLRKEIQKPVALVSKFLLQFIKIF